MNSEQREQKRNNVTQEQMIVLDLMWKWNDTFLAWLIVSLLT